MKKADFIAKVHDGLDGKLTKKDTEEFVDVVMTSLADAIREGERFSYPGFGTFRVKERPARKGRNPRTGEPIQIAASKTVSFKPSPKYKDTL